MQALSKTLTHQRLLQCYIGIRLDNSARCETNNWQIISCMTHPQAPKQLSWEETISLLKRVFRFHEAVNKWLRMSQFLPCHRHRPDYESHPLTGTNCLCHCVDLSWLFWGGLQGGGCFFLFLLGGNTIIDLQQIAWCFQLHSDSCGENWFANVEMITTEAMRYNGSR